MSITRGTVHSIQFLRFLAAALVVIFHAHLAVTTRLTQGVADQSGYAAYLFGFGASGVHIFFVISGYIMYLTTVGRGGPHRPITFLTRRGVRIYPIYWVFVLLYLAGRALLAEPYRFAGERVLGALLLLPRDAPLFIGPSWTLSFELYFYLVFAVAMIAGGRRGLIGLTLLFLGSVAAGYVFRPSEPIAALATSSLLLEFAVGAWISRWTFDRSWPRALGWCAIVAAMGGFAAGIGYGYQRLPSALIWGAPSALLVFGAVVLERWDGLPGTRRLSVLGDSSYVLYLCHILLIDLFIAALRAGVVATPLVIILPIIVVACVAAAHALHLGIERPMVARLHHWTKPRHQSGANTTA